MKILAGMTANRNHITAKGGPTHFSDALNKLILKAMNTTHKFMVSEFGSKGKAQFRGTTGEGSAGTLTLSMLKVGGALPMVQIRAEKDGLHVFSWVENKDSGDDLLNKLIGKLGWMDVGADDFEWSLDSALVSNKKWGSLISPNAKADISSFCRFVIKKYLKSNIKSSANLTAAKVTKKKVTDRLSRNALIGAHNELEKWAGGYMCYRSTACIAKSNLMGTLVIPICVPSYRKDRRIEGVLKVEHGSRNCLDGSIEVRDLDTKDVFKCSIESTAWDTPKMFIDSLEDFLSYHYLDDKSEKSIRSVMFDYADRIGFFDEDEEDY